MSIIGLGLMGGSLARALKAHDPTIHIVGAAEDPFDLERALEDGVLDRAAKDSTSLLADRDLVVYATPLSATLTLLEEHSGQLDPATVLTDMVSLKAPVFAQVQTLGLGSRFVGSHPMVGGTGRGYRFSEADLFSGGRVWVVEGEGASTTDQILDFWRCLGGEPSLIEAFQHDELMARVSHLPQMTSTALAWVLKEAGIPREALGPGGRDMTRLAGSQEEMWGELLAAAPDTLNTSLEGVEEAVARLRKLLESGKVGEVGRMMEETRGWLEESS